MCTRRTFICKMVLKVLASMGQSSDEPFKKPPPVPWPKGKPPPPFKQSPPLPYPKGKPPPPGLEGKAPPVLPKRFVMHLHVRRPRPPPPQQPAVASAAMLTAAAAAAASEEQADAGNADEAATCAEQVSSVKAPPFKKPPPPPPPFAQISRFAQLNTIRCQCSCGLLRRDACEKNVCLPRRLCADCMDITYIRTNMGAVCGCRCRECK
jgi:hypothetical protein